MPIYEYECRNCGVRFERMQRMLDEPLTLCPECQQNALIRVVQPVGVIFKGGGFYVTDNRGKSSTGPSAGKSETPKETSSSSADSTTSTASTTSDKPSTSTTSGEKSSGD